MSTPPPFLYAVGGTIPSSSSSLPLSHSHDSPSQNIKPSILTLILILSITIIVSTSLCLLLRFLSNRCRHRSHSTPDEHSTEVVSGRLSSFRENRFSSRRVSPEDRSLLDSLPLFTFNSVVSGGRSYNSSLAGGDCAICLSKFEPHDQLRLLPICCHAFHVNCVDTWLLSNQTCPLCRSSIFAFDSDVLRKFLSPSDAGGEQSFRIEIGNVSRGREMSDSGEARRSYSIGSFDYIVEDESEVTVVSSQARGTSGGIYVDKDESVSTATAPEQETEQRGQSLAAEVGSGRSWLREYVDRISASLSTRALSFRSSGRYFTGSSRRSENDGAGNWDVEASRAGEEISEIFRWFSGYES